MKMPNKDKAIISKEKLLNYLLSETHPVGSSKAKFFRNLGFNKKNVDELKRSLLKIVKENDVKDSRKSIYGINYMIEGKVQSPSGKKIRITTVWFAKTVKSKPSFVTAYPKK